MITKALALATHGLTTFPCLDTKAPACPGGFKAASKDKSAIRELWRRYPGPLIGVPTGSMNGFDVLDVDPRHGGDAWLEQHSLRLPPTRVHVTRSGGRHLLFHHLAGVRNSAGRIDPGVDVRGDGGYVVWWPAAGLRVERSGLLAGWPSWLRPLIRPRPRPCLPAAAPVAAAGSRYVEAALRSAIEHITGAGEGTRNTILNQEAFALCRFVRNGNLSTHALAEALAAAALQAGLPAREVATTLASALCAGGAS